MQIRLHGVTSALRPLIRCLFSPEDMGLLRSGPCRMILSTSMRLPDRCPAQMTHIVTSGGRATQNLLREAAPSDTRNDTWKDKPILPPLHLLNMGRPGGTPARTMRNEGKHSPRGSPAQTTLKTAADDQAE